MRSIAGALVIVAAALFIGLGAIADGLNPNPYLHKESAMISWACGGMAALLGLVLIFTNKRQF
jgi:hypothetical protein